MDCTNYIGGPIGMSLAWLDLVLQCTTHFIRNFIDGNTCYLTFFLLPKGLGYSTVLERVFFTALFIMTEPKSKLVGGNTNNIYLICIQPKGLGYSTVSERVKDCFTALIIMTLFQFIRGQWLMIFTDSFTVQLKW